MKNTLHLCLLSIILITVSSCSNKQDYSSILTNAEQVRKSNPDSVLILLEDIEDIKDLDEKQYATYMLLKTEAKDKTYNDLSNDTLLHIAINYFVKSKSYQEAAYAYFYQNRIYQSQNQTESAIKYCCVAKIYAEKMQDFNLLGMIYHDLGYLYKEQFNFEETINSYRKSLDYFHKARNNKYITRMYKRIGDIYLVSHHKESTDSAFTNYQKALELAQKENAQEELYYTYQSISLNLYETNQFEKAKFFIKNAIQTVENSHENFNNYIYLSRIYLNLNKPDSSLFFLNKASSLYTELDYNDKYLYKKLEYRINYIKKDYLSAIHNLEDCFIYKDSIYKDIISQKIIYIQKKYNTEIIENEKNELLIQRLYFSIFCTVLIFSIPTIVVIFRNKNQKQKEKQLKVHQELLFMEEMLQSKKNKENKLRELLLEKLDVARKVALMKTYTKKNNSDFIKQYHEIFGSNMYDTINWKNLYPIFNELYNNIIIKLKDIYPSLTEKELQQCCLVRADFNADEIALFLSYEYNSVRTTKMRLRKKMGFENNEEFMQFLIDI